MIIGITGKKGSGKSVVANYLTHEHNFTPINFKDGLKIFMLKTLPDVLSWCKEHYQMTDEELFQNKPPLFRALMQNIGTDLVRMEVSQDFWINLWSKSITNSRANKFVTDDVRFQNEADAVRLSEGIIVRIIREDLESNDIHVSETEQDSIEADFTIVAKTGEHQLVYNQIETILDTIKSD